MPHDIDDNNLQPLMYAGYIDSISIIKLGTSVAAYIVFYHDLQTAVVYILTM